LAAFEKLSRWPDLIFFDGQGIAHPRKIGIASHIGVLLDLPSIGVAKSPLAVRGPEPAQEPGSWTPWHNRRGEVLAAAVRTKARSKPLYISPGHKMDLPSAVRYVLEACRGYRLPEPTRQAHNAAALAE
jgi:deoxyribonuclease V